MRNAGLLLVGLTACTTTSGVGSKGLDDLAGAHGEDAYYVRDDSGGRIRIDPNTRVRFKRTDGRHTPWVRARHLHTNRHGVFRVHRLPLTEARRVEATTLTANIERAAIECVPSDAQYRNDDGVLRIFGAPGSVDDWVSCYVDLRGSDPRLAASDWRRGEGRFRFGFGFGGWSRPIDGRGLVGAMHDGLDVELGLAFRDIRDTEVENFSGSKSLALVVGSAAVIAAIVAAAKGDVGAAHATVQTGEVVARTVAYVAYCGMNCGARRPPLPTGAIGATQTSTPDAMAVQPLFDGTARRRADITITASAQGSYDFGERGFGQTAAVTGRIRNFFEIGAGGRRVQTRDRGTPRYLAFARAGGTFHLDEAHRISVAILGDLGAGSQITQAKLNIGLRVRVAEELAIGAFLFSPTYTVERRLDDHESDWSFPSGLEVSYSF